MRLLWDLYWPGLVAALAIGIVAGVVAFRQRAPRRRVVAMAIGAVAALAATALWHGPAGAAARFGATVENAARATLDHYEMVQVQAGLDRDPLSRALLLSGEADDFQRSELIRIMDAITGVAAVRWRDTGQGSSFPLPLLAEVELWTLVAFGLGVLLSYLIELRRRARAEWRW